MQEMVYLNLAHNRKRMDLLKMFPLVETKDLFIKSDKLHVKSQSYAW